jgi:hypothetical protein
MTSQLSGYTLEVNSSVFLGLIERECRLVVGLNGIVCCAERFVVLASNLITESRNPSAYIA